MSPQSLKTHLQVERMGVKLKKLACNKCENEFVSRSNLKMHLKTIHSKISQCHTCEECKKEFGNAEKIEKTHQKIFH